jgi:outer membrane lipase/esterase
MNIKKRILPAVLSTLFALGAGVDAEAAPFSGVVVFGDSLSDAGYFRPFLASRGFRRRRWDVSRQTPTRSGRS